MVAVAVVEREHRARTHRHLHALSCPHKTMLDAAVRRPRLVRALRDPDGPPLVAVVAPAGYGKTTLLREWAERDWRPFAWVTLDERDNDAGRLPARVASAMDDAVGEGSEVPFALVLDDVHALRGAAAVRALRAIANDLPHEATLVLAARSEPPLPLARLRSQDLVLELGPRDLALTRAETAALLRGAGHPLDREGIEWLHQRTEGWPVGLSLAGRFLDERGAAGGVRRFGGADRLVAGYVRDEVLAGLPPAVAEVLLRTSVLDTLTGPLCDALLERSGSAAILADLARAGVLVPLDRADTRFRHHRLIAGALRTELRRTRPDLEAELHRRASAWHRGEHDADRAIAHALLAGDTAGAADLVWTGVPEAVAQGRIAALERRLGRFTPEQIAGRPRLALSAAACALVLGNGYEVEHWASAAAAGRDPAGDPAAVDAAVAILRAAVGTGGPRQMRDDAARAAALQPEDSPWRSLSCLVSGAAQRLLGDDDAARAALEEGARGAAVTAPLVHALCLAELAVLAIDEDDWEGAAALATRARAQLDRHGLGQCPTSAIVYAVSAVVRAHRGRIDGARSDLDAAASLRDALTDFPPWYDADVSMLLFRAALRLSDSAAAREHLERTARLLRRVPDAVVLHAALAGAWGQLDTFGTGAGAPPCSMTAAELRILRFLPTHLSFREIAERPTCRRTRSRRRQRRLPQARTSPAAPRRSSGRGRGACSTSERVERVSAASARR